MNVIIIEDERRTANELKMMLEQFDISTISILTSVSTAIDWLKHNPVPDLIFSDIQLGDGLSFEIFREVEVAAPIIFCTAFDEYAIEAFEANGVDYLLKPLEEEMIERSIKKYHRLKKVFSQDNLKKAVTQIEANYRQFILVHFREKIVPVKVDNLNYVYAASGFVSLKTADNNEYVVPMTVDQLEAMLNPKHFFRANRQFILNRKIIENIEHHFNRRLLVRTLCPTPAKIIISRLKAQEFLRWIEQ